MSIVNQGFPAFRADLNDALPALASNNSGATEPSTMFAHQWWVDTSATPNLLKQRNADNDAWITVGSLDQSADTFTLAAGSAGAFSTLSASGTSTLAAVNSGALAVTGAISATEIISANKGITFPATQVASADANTLDDYEEGTWTPSIGGDATYDGRNGRYTKIGNLVTVQFEIGISTKGTGSATALSGLPFAAANLGTVQTGCVSYFNDMAVSVYFLAFYIENASTTCQFVSTNSLTGSVVNGAEVFGNGSSIYGSASYYVS